ALIGDSVRLQPEQIPKRADGVGQVLVVGRFNQRPAVRILGDGLQIIGKAAKVHSKLSDRRGIVLLLRGEQSFGPPLRVLRGNTMLAIDEYCAERTQDHKDAGTEDERSPEDFVLNFQGLSHPASRVESSAR